MYKKYLVSYEWYYCNHGVWKHCVVTFNTIEEARAFVKEKSADQDYREISPIYTLAE